jgi:hypothetical protein
MVIEGGSTPKSGHGYYVILTLGVILEGNINVNAYQYLQLVQPNYTYILHFIPIPLLSIISSDATSTSHLILGKKAGSARKQWKG